MIDIRLHPIEPLDSLNSLQKFDFEILSSCDNLIGVDEAGRGALAGPVYAGASVLGRAFFESSDLLSRTERINDSKQVTLELREAFFADLIALRTDGILDFEFGVGSVEEIAELNILGATKLAMRRAVDALAERAAGWCLPESYVSEPLFLGGNKVPRAHCIVDGRPLKHFPYEHTGIVKGDAKSLAIAIGSIVAKVCRDKEMKAQADVFPHYGFEIHKGYGTRAHRDAILEFGPCQIHRKLFLRKILG